MSNYSEVELLLNEESVKYSIDNNDFFVSNESSNPLELNIRHNFQKPRILQKSNIEFVQFSPNSYVLGHFINIISLPKSETITNMIFEYDTFTTLSPLSVITNNSAIMLAYYSGIIDDFVGEKLTLTHTGVLPQSNFNFFVSSINNKLQRIKLRNYSSYVNGVFEGPNKVVLVINELHKTDDISLKDLFLPYLYWQTKTAKEINIVYMSFSNDIYNLYKINFQNQDIMNLASITAYSSYKVSNDIITFEDIMNLFDNISIVEEKEIPFPQANDIQMVIDLVHLLNDSELTLKDITDYIKYDVRQSKYYIDAAIYLNLVEERHVGGKNKEYTLTELAKEIVSTRIKSKYLKITEKILEHRVFYEVMKLYINTSKLPSNSEIVTVMKEVGVYNLSSDSTFIRRASTVQAWIKWIKNLPKIYY